jgi:hypothetical protein
VQHHVMGIWMKLAGTQTTVGVNGWMAQGLRTKMGIPGQGDRDSEVIPIKVSKLI